VWKVKFFKTGRGATPVLDFIENQDNRIKTKFGKLVRLLINNGPLLRPPQSKKIAKDLYELRSSGKDPLRIFYTSKDKIYYLIHIFKKKSQKTPPRELKTALDRIKEIT
jgi:phage-related protein